MKFLLFKMILVLSLLGMASVICFAQEETDFDLHKGMADNAVKDGDEAMGNKKYSEAREKYKKAIAEYRKAVEDKDNVPKDFSLDAKIKECNDKINKANEALEGGTSNTPLTKRPVSKPVKPSVKKKEPDGFNIKEVRFQEREPWYLGEVKQLTPEIRYGCNKSGAKIILKIVGKKPSGEEEKHTCDLSAKKTIGNNSEWYTVPSFKEISEEGKYTFTIYRVIDNGEIIELTKVEAPQIQEKTEVSSVSQPVTSDYRESKKVATQTYEWSSKGNPFALRTSQWDTYHWGISAGYVSKKWKYKDLDGETQSYGLLKDKSMPGIQAGIHYEGFFMPKICGLGIATGAYYEYYWQKGDTQSEPGYDDYYVSYKEHNVYVPLNLLFRFDFSEKVNIALYGGIGANYGVGNKCEWKNASDDEAFQEEKGLYDYDEWGIKRFFMNIEYGGSVRIGRLSVNARFFSPLTDWSEDKFYSEKPVKDMNLSVSFMF